MRLNVRLTPKWWYWLAAVVPLGAALAGWKAGLVLACVATGAQIIRFAAEAGGLRSLSVQTPMAFLGLLVLGAWPPLAILHWLQFVGTTIRLLFDYCILARTLALAPWNCREPLSWWLVKRVYLTPPVAGSILEHAMSSATQRPFPLRRAS
jgi:hypothetical protein